MCVSGADPECGLSSLVLLVTAGGGKRSGSVPVCRVPSDANVSYVHLPCAELCLLRMVDLSSHQPVVYLESVGGPVSHIPCDVNVTSC